jgi:hypothetical protein
MVDMSEPPRVIRGPRLFGWALAFTIVGTSFAFVLLVTIVLAILFADRLPQ